MPTYIEKEALVVALDNTDSLTPDALSTINAMPLADVAPVRRGRWIDEGNGLYSCSECLVLDHREPRHNFCPSCGAKMESKGEGI